MCIALFFACFMRRSKEDKQADEYLEECHDAHLARDEEYLPFAEVRFTLTSSCTHSRLQDVSTFADRARSRPVRLEPNEVTLLREQRLRDMKMREMIREVLTYCCVLVLINLFASSRLDSNSSTQVNHLRRLFLNTRQNQHDYTQVTSTLSTNDGDCTKLSRSPRFMTIGIGWRAAS